MRQFGIKAVAALALGAGAVLAVLAVPAVASTAATAIFGELRLGAWEIRERGEAQSRRVCLRTERDLVQLRHRGQNCRRFVIDESGPNATVQYSCGASGYGRTLIRKETQDLVQLRSDGIEGGFPFSFEAEGRRVGSCN